MDKRWNRGVTGITEKYLETVTVFPFERHARWIQYKKNKSDKKPDDSRENPVEWDLERYPISILKAPAVFSSAVLDAGTAAFIEVFPENRAESSSTIVDLGCGSGLLGLCGAYNNPKARIIFTDESFLAVENAKTNYIFNKLSADAEFLVTNGAEGIADESVDLVLCNPPFHYQNIQSREPAQFLFSEAKLILKPAGTIQIVGNSHLGYHKLLPEYFSLVKEMFRDSRFTVLRGTRTT
jgi:16S rRNA (guanine1207-N2)-methyltransferase